MALDGRPNHTDTGAVSLAGGAENVTVRTIPANRISELRSCLATYTGTVSGVTLQLLVGGEPVAPAVTPVTSGIPVDLLGGRVVVGTAAELVEIAVTGGTASDTLRGEAHFTDAVG